VRHGTGFNWNPTLPGGWTGQLADNGPYPSSWSSPTGQKAFVDVLVTAMRSTPRVLGVLYRDPIMIERQGFGWVYRDSNGTAGPNQISNTTLFDFNGKALPILDGSKTTRPGTELGLGHQDKQEAPSLCGSRGFIRATGRP
jgi:arabinogalactan endo-1,4-beta-galactosidase